MFVPVRTEFHARLLSVSLCVATRAFESSLKPHWIIVSAKLVQIQELERSVVDVNHHTDKAWRNVPNSARYSLVQTRLRFIERVSPQPIAVPMHPHSGNFRLRPEPVRPSPCRPPLFRNSSIATWHEHFKCVDNEPHRPSNCFTYIDRPTYAVGHDRIHQPPFEPLPMATTLRLCLASFSRSESRNSHSAETSRYRPCSRTRLSCLY